MNILDETAAALPDVSHRLRDFLAPRMGRASGEPASTAPEAQAAEAESGSEDESAASETAECAICEGPHQDGMYHGPLAAPQPPADDSTPDEAGDAPHEPAPTAEADASALADHPLDGAQ